MSNNNSIVEKNCRTECVGEVDGKKVYYYYLTNRSGTELCICNYGATVVSLKYPDRTGEFADVVLGFNKLEKYRDDAYYACNPFMGGVMGRFANRIGGASYTLDTIVYRLEKNNGQNCIHSGFRGFDKVVWDSTPLLVGKWRSIELTYISPDGEGGFGGTLTTTVIYSLTDNDELKISYRATTDKPTVVNLTNHSYFNLSGEGTESILGTIVTINADYFTPSDFLQIPTGELMNVTGTPFDFRNPITIGARINDVHDQLVLGNGYDHNWVLNKEKESELSLAATAYDPSSGRFMEVFTTEPAMQFYTGNNLNETLIGKSGQPYVARSGFCFETQHFPDSPNKPQFPSTVLRPGETFLSSTIYRFSLR
jgi:aldose 1-epimerase